jgi:hypothetical protein
MSLTVNPVSVLLSSFRFELVVLAASTTFYSLSLSLSLSFPSFSLSIYMKTSFAAIRCQHSALYRFKSRARASNTSTKFVFLSSFSFLLCFARSLSSFFRLQPTFIRPSTDLLPTLIPLLSICSRFFPIICHFQPVDSSLFSTRPLGSQLFCRTCLRLDRGSHLRTERSVCCHSLQRLCSCVTKSATFFPL